jgi:hypothetical protein
MNGSLYEDEEEDGTPPTPPPEEQPAETSDLISKSVLGGGEFEPGQIVTLKIVRVLEDQVEVAPAEETSEEETQEPSAEEEIRSMAGEE